MVAHQRLGDSGLKVSKVIVGCMSYGSKKSLAWVLEDEAEIFKILKKCYDSGIRTFDTADAYSNGESEVILGKFLKHFKIPRNRVVILSKCFFPTDPAVENFSFHTANNSEEYEYINAKGLSRKHIFDAAQASVERLGTYMDVLQIHRLDKTTNKTEIMKALNDVVEQGLTRYIGASSMRATEFAELQFIADKNGWFKFISMQNYYNLLYREEEREMIPFCNESVFGKVGLIPWSPNARGYLARPVGLGSTERDESDKTLLMLGLSPIDDKNKEIIARVEEVAKELGVSMATVATAWVISKGCAPIVGLNSELRVDDAIKAIELNLSEEHIKYLEDLYAPRAIVGY